MQRDPDLHRAHLVQIRNLDSSVPRNHRRTPIEPVIQAGTHNLGVSVRNFSQLTCAPLADLDYRQTRHNKRTKHACRYALQLPWLPGILRVILGKQPSLAPVKDPEAKRGPGSLRDRLIQIRTQTRQYLETTGAPQLNL